MASLAQISSILAERAGERRNISFIKEMKDLVVIKRARFLANSLQKNPSMDKYYLNAFEVDVTLVDISDECNTDLEEMDCLDKAWKTVEVIPQAIRYNTNPYNYVGAPGGHNGFGITTFGYERYMKHSPLTGSNGRYAYVNDFIYTFNKELPKVRIEGVFSDPRQIAKFKSCSGNGPCFTEESEAFVDEQLAELIIKDTVTNELRLQLPDDRIQTKVDHNV